MKTIAGVTLPILNLEYMQQSNPNIRSPTNVSPPFMSQLNKRAKTTFKKYPVRKEKEYTEYQ